MTTKNKPYRAMLAEDLVWEKIKYPVGAQPKIDGVRLHNVDGVALGRSMKPHANLYTSQRYSNPFFTGLDGECAHGNWTDADLCRSTQSALSTIEGDPETDWWVFDMITPETEGWAYQSRYEYLQSYISGLFDTLYPFGYEYVKVVPMKIAHNETELRAYQDEWLEMGFEGLIIRDLNGKHKQGRSTVREGGLLRDKGFIDSEILVDEIEEAQENLNEATIDERGLTKRSSHKENKTGKGMIGNIWGTLLKDVIDPVTGAKLFSEGQRVKVGPGAMPHDERKRLFEAPDGIISHIVTFKHFPRGVKDKPRFPTYKSHRMITDL